MSVPENLALARTSIDLGDMPEGLGPIDWLRAAGAVGKEHSLALAIGRLVDQRDRSMFDGVLAGLLALCLRLGIRHNPIATTTHVLDWMAGPLCPACRGTGVVPSGLANLTRPCTDCSGTGHRPQADWADDEHRLYAQVQRMQSAAARAISERLAG